MDQLDNETLVSILKAQVTLVNENTVLKRENKHLEERRDYWMSQEDQRLKDCEKLENENNLLRKFIAANNLELPEVLKDGQD